MYKKVIATGGIVSSLLFTGGMGVYAQSTPTTQPGFRHVMGKMDASKLAEKFGLDATELQAEIDSGKKIPDILEEHGITRDKMVKFAKNHKDRGLEKALDVIAPKLGLNADDIRAELEAGKTFDQVLTENGITKDQIKETLGFRRGRMGPMTMSPAVLEIQANILGITSTELQAAFEAKQPLPEILTAHNLTMEQFREQVKVGIDAAISAGTITAEEAKFFQHELREPSATQLTIAANVLGITLEDLQAAREAKQSLEDIVAAHNLTMDEFHTQVRAAIEAAVAAGTMDENDAHFFHGRVDKPGRTK